MGLFDKFKKKSNNEIKAVTQEPLVLKHSDGIVTTVNFQGERDIDGKKVQVVLIDWQKEGEVRTKYDGAKVYYLEPISKIDASGNVVGDGTEEYYKQMAYSHNGLVKGFFKKQELEKMESDYIGNLAQKENGEYYRHYDMDFRGKMIEKKKAEIEEKRALKLRDSSSSFSKKLQGDVEENYVHIKTSHAEVLSPEMNPFKKAEDSEVR